MAFNITVQKEENGNLINVTYWDIVEFYAKPVEKYFVCVLRGYPTKQDYTDYLNTGVQKDKFRFEFSLSGPDYPDTTKADWITTTVEEYIRTQNKYGIDWTKATKELK